MTYITTGRRRISAADRIAALAVDFWRRWRRGRDRAKLRRQLADYDDHLLRDVGLLRNGELDPMVRDRNPLVSERWASLR
jgi:uncharacterized protein YjiS (DUF1127 family)